MHKMSTTAAEFAAARTEFHRLVELDAEARENALADLAQADAVLADAVRELFGRFDERDLVPPPEIITPERLGPFRVLRLLGRGGMGEVYAGERADGAFEQQVALKLIRASHAGLGLDGRFARERQILARLEHPRIARLIDGGTSASGQPWLAMEFVDGLDLTSWVDATRANLARRITLFLRICDAVAFAHRALIVHCDLKPANVLVDADDEPKLLDFGIAKLVDDESAALTHTAAAGLTLRYAAPEQVLGDRTSTATDVYALGVVLFELIARRSPYVAADDDRASWRDSILRGETHALATVLDRSLLSASECRRAARELAPVVRKAMALSPSDRYSGVAALAEDLQDWCAGRPFRSGIGSVSARAWLFLGRHRWAVVAGIIATAALCVATVIALQEAAEARHQARVASANVDALLGVLSAANPMHYAGRDPTASEFLVTAAAQIRRDHARDPALVFRALGEIGHGLINLGHADRAEPVLLEALAAADRDPSIGAVERLGYLKLLALSFDGEDRAELPQVHAVADRIDGLAREVVNAPIAADALASVAAMLSRLGDQARAAELFGRAVAGLNSSDMPSAMRENIWRQKGWAALRSGDAGTAMRDFVAMRAVIDAAPQAFDLLRVAEADGLLAEAAVDVGDGALALQYLARAEPILLAEFGTTHPERRVIGLTRIAALLAKGEIDAAMLAFGIIAASDFPPPTAVEQIRIDLLFGDLMIQSRRCSEAAAMLATRLAQDLSAQPRLQRMQARVLASRERNCD
ncbi:MAG: serine/threonine protein kinase [Xanthomonadales bacterium]|nr:serine/threonine protein kinase [Xanthomonadales bacterium]